MDVETPQTAELSIAAFAYLIHGNKTAASKV
jgi:hypothetical protein